MEYQTSPHEIFESRKDELISLEINGIHTFALEMEDEIGKYFAIPALDSRICQPFPEYLQGHFINHISYDTYCGKRAILKAYYLF